MSRKPLYFSGVIFLLLGVFYLLFYSTHSPFRSDTSVDENRLSSEAVASLRKKYPHLQAHPVEWVERLKEKQTSTWEEWIDTNVELSMNEYIAMRWNAGDPLPWVLETYDTPEKLATKEASFRKFHEASAKGWQDRGMSVPPTVEAIPPDYWEIESKPVGVAYEGPQTPEAIMERFDVLYTGSDSSHTDHTSPLDVAYSKETWIQDFLNKGAEFKNFGDYDKYISSRGVFMNRSKDPSLWASGRYGIRPSSTLEEYKEAFIEREIWIQNTWNRVKEEHPDATGMAIEGEHYLPFKDNLTYVRRNGPSTVTWGTMLSDEDMANLTRGIEPEGIEIVYIDNDYNLLSEKPSPWDPKRPDAKAVTEQALKEIMPELRTFEDSDVPMEPDAAPVRGDEDPVGPDVDLDAMRREAAREAAAREVAKAEFERFQDSMRQRKEFETMADKEVSRELAKQFSQQFLSKYSLKQGTSKQLENALELMFQHGFEEGFRRVRQDSPSIADQLERYLAETQKSPKPQKKPQRPTQPKPSETPPSQPDAP